MISWPSRCLCLLLLGLCLPVASSEEWVQHPERTVLGGDLLHWGAGLGTSSEVAMFKAENMALRSLVLECGFPHVEMKIWERSLRPDGPGFRAFARAGIEIGKCQAMRKMSAVEREKLESADLRSNLDLYDRYLKNELMPESDAPSLKKLEISIVELIRKNQKSINQSLLRVESKVDALAKEKQEGKYNECMEEFHALELEASQESIDSAGSMRHEKADRLRSKALDKFQQCRVLKIP